MEFRLYQYKEIDKTKWDKALLRSKQALIYANSWYLDIVTGSSWDAWIGGDYEILFPLPYHRKKLGIKTYYQPLLCQQLGMFICTEKDALITGVVNQFTEETKIKKRLSVLALHEKSLVLAFNRNGFETSPRDNFILPLGNSYETIAAGYSQRVKRSLKKAQCLEYKMGNVSVDIFCKAIEQYHREKENAIPKRIYRMMPELVNTTIAKGMGEIYTAVYNGEIIAMLFLTEYQNRWTDLLNITMPLGRDLGAMHFLIDRFIQEKAATPEAILDFEGSSIPGVAAFYKSFGAINSPYFVLKNSHSFFR